MSRSLSTCCHSLLFSFVALFLIGAFALEPSAMAGKADGKEAGRKSVRTKRGTPSKFVTSRYTAKPSRLKMFTEGRRIVKAIKASESAKKLAAALRKRPLTEEEKNWKSTTQHDSMGIYAVETWVRVLDAVDGKHDVYISEHLDVAMVPKEHRAGSGRLEKKFFRSLQLGKFVTEAQLLGAVQDVLRSKESLEERVRSEMTFESAPIQRFR